MSLPLGNWCYLVWYLVTVVLHFDPSPAIWLNSAGLSLVIGFALKLGVAAPAGANAPARADRWQNMRIFLTPFCVSSFAALIKGKGYVLIAPPDLFGLSLSVGCCLALVLIVMAVKALAKKAQP